MPDGSPIEVFAGIPWSQYLNGMWRDGNYGEEITLHAIANIFGNEIFVVSILRQQGIVYISSHSCILYWRTVFFYLVLKAKFKPMEEQSDPLGDKSDLITDEINSRKNGINRPGNDLSLGKNEINQSENDINLEENEINWSENDINLGESEINWSKNGNNSRENESNPLGNKVVLDERELDQVSIDFEQVENDFKLEQNEINQVRNDINLRISRYESNNWSTGDTGKIFFMFFLSQITISQVKFAALSKSNQCYSSFKCF